MFSPDEWKELCFLYLHTKNAVIKAEECGLETKAFLQPIIETRDAFDHIIRVAVFSYSGEKTESDNPNYGHINYSKARDHLYRAFCDASEHLSLKYRELILNTLEGYTNDIISKCLPEYYPKLRPRIEEIEEEIAKLRMDKDIGKLSSNENINKFADILEEIRSIYKQISQSKPSLIEAKKKDKIEQYKTRIIYCLIGAIVPTAIFILNLIFN